MRPSTEARLRQLASRLNELKTAVHRLRASAGDADDDAISAMERDIDELASSQNALVNKLQQSAEGSGDAAERLMQVLERGGAQLKADIERVLALLK